MPINVLMPALSPTMTEGTLAKWHVKEGDEVSSGDVIAEIETDKATMEVEAVEEGTLGKILIGEGTEGVAVNSVIAILLEEGESAGDIDVEAAKAKAPASPGGEEKEAKAEAPAPSPAPSAAPSPAPAPEPAPAPQGAPVAAQAPSSGESGERIFASPLARRMAEQSGLDLGQIKGSGPHGRIVKADIEGALQAGTGKAAPAETPAPAAAAPAAAPAQGTFGKAFADSYDIPYRQEPLSGMRKVIAQRLTESKQTVPHFYLTIDCELDAVLKVRADLNARAPEGEGSYKLSVNDFVIRASALALHQVPQANAAFDPSGLVFFERADVSVAVATPVGLITPIIKGADGKGLAQISREMRELATKARDGKLKPEEYQGGTFSVSNLGMFGVKQFEAVINAPQGCILAVGAGEQRAIVKDGAVTSATMMSCTLSVDHRVVDGAVGAQFLAAFKKLIEDPLTMLL
jgi:pyruvate dehydrogenase E2 component (dihydrolipoamide acetyltransferase)